MLSPRAPISDGKWKLAPSCFTLSSASEVENYANLASYLLVDAFAQHTLPTGHGLNPVPVTEALRIPEIDEIVDGGKTFKERVLQGLGEAGIAIDDPFELLLSIRRIGAKRLEELFGPGKPTEGVLRNRTPVVRATTVAALEAQGDGVVAKLSPSDQSTLRTAGLTGCVTCTER
jgi:hypothetical protein